MRHPHPNRDHDPLRPSDDSETYEEEIVSVTTLTETPKPPPRQRKRYKPGEPRPSRGRPKANRLPQPQLSPAQAIAHNHIRSISNDTQHSKPAPLPHDLIPNTPVDTIIPYDPLKDARKYQAILSHPHADIIIAQLIDGQTPLLQIQNRYGIDQHQLADFARARLLAPAALVARKREQESGERIIDRLSSMMDRLSKLIDAADAYLSDPADPSRYTLSPRAQEIGIVYAFTSTGPNGRPRVTRRSCRLQTLIDALETIPIDPADPPTRDQIIALIAASRRTDQTLDRTVSPAPEPPLDQPAPIPAIPQGETPPDSPTRPPHPRATPGPAAATTEDDFSVSIPFGDLVVEDLRYGGQDARKTLVEAVKGMKECLTLMGKVEGSVRPMDRMVMESPQMRAVMEVVMEVGAEYPEMVKKLTERMRGM